MKIPVLPFTLAILALSAPLGFAASPAQARPAVTAPGGGNADWPTYLGDKGRTLYSPLAQINRGNIKDLKVAWVYDTGDKGEYQANNLIVGGVLYTATPSRKVVALNAETGTELWKWDDGTSITLCFPAEMVPDASWTVATGVLTAPICALPFSSRVARTTGVTSFPSPPTKTLSSIPDAIFLVECCNPLQFVI